MKTYLNKQHDYITLRMVASGGVRLNITTSRRGESASGNAGGSVLRTALVEFAGLRDRLLKSGKTNGDVMEILRGLAAKTDIIEDFLAAVKNYAVGSQSE